MAKTIKNMSDLSKALEPKINKILDAVAEDVKAEIDTALNDYYDEYDPVYYTPRTDQLRNCCKISGIKQNGGKLNIEIYLDVDSLHYSTNGADPYKTVVAANAGLHGGWDVDNTSSGQVSWSAISSNSGEAYGAGTQIWEEPMRELFDNGKLIALFKKHAKAHGLNIK